MSEMTPITPEMMQPVEQPEENVPFIPERLRGEVPVESENTNWTVPGIFAIIAFVAFAITLYIVFQDWGFLKNA